MWGFPGSLADKESASNAGDPGLIPGSERYSGGGHGNPLQYSCHGQRSLESYSAWGLKDSDMTERLTLLLIATVNVGGLLLGIM